MRMWCLTLTWGVIGSKYRSMFIYVFIVKYFARCFSQTKKILYIYLMPWPSLPVSRRRENVNIPTVQALFGGIVRAVYSVIPCYYVLPLQCVLWAWNKIVLKCVLLTHRDYTIRDIKFCYVLFKALGLFWPRNSDLSWNISRKQCTTRVYTSVFRI